MAASQENKSIRPEGSCLPAQLASHGYAGRSWPPNHPSPSPILHPVCRMLHALLSPPNCSPSTQGGTGSLPQPSFPPPWPCHRQERHQPGPALTTAPSRAPGTGAPPAQPHRAIKDGFHPKALPFVPKAPGLMPSNAPAICRAAPLAGALPACLPGTYWRSCPGCFLSLLFTFTLAE